MSTSSPRRQSAVRAQRAPKPKKSAAAGHVPVLYVRCNDEEDVRYRTKFAKSGLRSLSDWVRIALNTYCEEH